ncbi:MAG: hypothetical protein QOI13_115 [Paraburkholderia sp.]|jgi:hypothetical protein|nr:hypothetical protein [Paraburkholderia sp.]
MDRLARLMPLRRLGPLGRFGRFGGLGRLGRPHHLRSVVPCPPLETPLAADPSPLATLPLDAQPSALPAFARVSLKSALHTEPAQRAPVRVYHGTSRVILVGTVDAVCRMIDRCIDEERAGTSATQLG